MVDEVVAVTTLDEAARIATDYNAAGELIRSRPFTAAEAKPLDDLLAAAAIFEANRRTIEQALDADLVELQALIDSTNATINAGPAPYIKLLARVARRLVRIAIRKLDGTT